jgi:hypothetical protein
MKEVNEADFYKKCGFKNNKDFNIRHTWTTQSSGQSLYISLYAKNKSKTANFVNKYEFPPPVASELYFGTCMLISYTLSAANGSSPKKYTSLTPDIWKPIYTKLYGGFENLADTEVEDEAEPDELEGLPKHKLTKTGYLKDGFVVDDDELQLDDISEPDSDDSSMVLGGDPEEVGEDVQHVVPKKRKTRSTGVIRHVPILSEELKMEDFV